MQERFQTIDRENQILLEKLVSISKKDNVTTQKRMIWFMIVSPKPVFSTTKQDFRPEKNRSSTQTLHAIYRKEVMRRIYVENEAFAKRLLSQ